MSVPREAYELVRDAVARARESQLKRIWDERNELLAALKVARDTTDRSTLFEEWSVLIDRMDGLHD